MPQAVCDVCVAACNFAQPPTYVINNCFALPCHAAMRSNRVTECRSIKRTSQTITQQQLKFYAYGGVQLSLQQM